MAHKSTDNILGCIKRLYLRTLERGPVQSENCANFGIRTLARALRRDVAGEPSDKCVQSSKLT